MRLCYRNTDEQWLIEFLSKGEIKPYMQEKRFISLSFDKDSGEQDNFGDVRVVFDYNTLLKQHPIEIYYEPEFMEQYPDICMYVTGYDGRFDYEEQHDENDLSWETTIEDFQEEEEIVIKKIRFEESLIIAVIFKKEPSKLSKMLCRKFGIKIIINEQISR